MVNTLLRLLAGRLPIVLLELLGVVMVAVALGARFGTWSWELWVGFALLVKSFELDLTRPRRTG